MAMPLSIPLLWAQLHVFTQMLYDVLAVNHIGVLKSNFYSVRSLGQLGVAIRSIPRIWGLIGHSLYCAVLFPEFKDKPLLHYFSTYVAGFGGGTASSIITLACGKGAPPVGLFVDNMLGVTWTLSWLAMNYSPWDLMGRLNRCCRSFRVLTLLGLTLTRTNTIINRVNGAVVLFPGVVAAPLILPPMAACGGRMLSDILRVAYGFWGFEHRQGWSGQPAKQPPAPKAQVKPAATAVASSPQMEGDAAAPGKGNVTAAPGKRRTVGSCASESRGHQVLADAASPATPAVDPAPPKPSPAPPRPGELSVPSSSARTAVGFAAMYYFLCKFEWGGAGAPWTPLSADEAYALVMLTAVVHSLAVEILGTAGDFTRPVAALLFRICLVPMPTQPVAVDWAAYGHGSASSSSSERGNSKREKPKNVMDSSLADWIHWFQDWFLVTARGWWGLGTGTSRRQRRRRRQPGTGNRKAHLHKE